MHLSGTTSRGGFAMYVALNGYFKHQNGVCGIESNKLQYKCVHSNK